MVAGEAPVLQPKLAPRLTRTPLFALVSRVRTALILLAGAALAACRPAPIVVDGPVLDPPPPPPPIAPPAPGGPVRPLQVAVSPARPASHRMVTVDARSPRTSVGRFPAGTKLRISVVDAHWNEHAQATFVGAEGRVGRRCGAPGRVCVGSDDAPPMGLVLLTNAGAGESPRRGCAPEHRLFIPRGVEFLVPEDAELAVGPNEVESRLGDNVGSLRVSVEVSQGRSGKVIGKRTIEVDARAARTSLGRFHAGEYLRISVVGGRWGQDQWTPLVDAAGLGKTLCGNLGPELCPGGDSRAPSMGLILLMGPCVSATPAPVWERQYIPAGVTMTLRRDTDVALGPNDWEDACADNAGAVLVDVEAEGP